MLEVVSCTDVLYKLSFAIVKLLATSTLSLEAQMFVDLDNQSRCYGYYTLHEHNEFVMFYKMLVSGGTYAARFASPTSSRSQVP